MTRLSAFIVDKRKAFLLVFAIIAVYCVANAGRVIVNNDITSYLPSDTETRRGLTIMNEEFKTYGTAKVMISNITCEEAGRLAAQVEEVEGVDSVAFDNSEEHYKSSTALLDVSFDAEAADERAISSMNRIEALLSEYDLSVSTEVGLDTAAQLRQEMRVILVVAAIIIVVVLLFTSKSYMEVPVYIIVFAMAALMNMGTNYWFGSISFITNAIAVVLQLALAIDYAIIFCHRYMEELDNGLDARGADVAALSKAIVEISYSSLTTISGMVALMFMQLKIGFDMGSVMTKGILCSMLAVFFLMPGLLLMFSGPIEKFRHANLVPHIDFWGRIVVKLRYVLPPVFLLLISGCIYFSNHCEYVFSTNSITGTNKPAHRLAAEKIDGVFKKSNTVAMLVPRGDYEKEKKILQRAAELPEIRTVAGLASVAIDDTRMVTDKLTPRQFSELAGVDVELARLLYQAYGISHEEYGAIFGDTDSYAVPLLDVFRFLTEQIDKGVVNLSGEQAERVADLRVKLDFGLAQLEGENWSRMVFTADTAEEGEIPYELLSRLRGIAAAYYGEDVILVGNTTNAWDLSSSFSGDNLKISILTALFVMVILLFTFQSAGLPVLLVLTIQGSIWINFSFPYLWGTNMYFLSYLVVSSIQMGATIDYAIVITNRYMELKGQIGPREAVVTSLDQSFPTVFTSGSIMTVAGFLIGSLSTDSTISSVGLALGRGTLISIVLVMTVLPQFLILGDALIERTALTLSQHRKKRFNRGVMSLDGHVRGRVDGFLDGEFKGVIRGSVDALIESKNQPKPLDMTPEEVGESDAGKSDAGEGENA